MTTTKRDPLLLAARLCIVFLIAVLGFACAVLAIAAPTALVLQGRIIEKFATEGVAAGSEMIGAIVLALAILAVLAAMGVYFFVQLRRIVASVGEGDPFMPENAERLARMGWTAAAVQVLVLPLGGIAQWLAKALEKLDNIHVDGDFGLNIEGILLVLILFILARVFRHGTEMREDLEGTV